jgi:lipopolysaccharide export system permease protein
VQAVKKIDSFVLKSFIGPLVLTFFIVLIILILQFLWMYVDELAGKGLDFKILAELLFQFSLTFVPTALPLAILLASLMTFGNMGEFSELTALKSSGIPLQRIMSPLIILITAISIASFFFSNNVMPYSNRKARTLLYDIRRKRPELNIQAGTFYNGIDGFSIKVTSKDPVTNRLDKLLIYDHRDRKGNTSVTYADSGYMKITPDETGMIMTLYSGYTNEDIIEKNAKTSTSSYPFRKNFFREQTIVISLSGLDLDRSQMDLFKSNSATMNISQLSFYIDSLSNLHTEKKDAYYTEFNNSILYQGMNYPPPVSKSSDSIDVAKPPIFNTRALLDSLSVMERESIIALAIEKLKNANIFLSQKNEFLHYELKIIKQFEVDWNKKLTLSFACLVFFFIGAPLGAIIRKGGLGTPTVISILFFVIYYVLSISAEKLVKEDIVSTFAGMWAASYILLPIGVFLTYKATTDSTIMNIETWFNVFKKVTDFIYRIVIKGTYENPPTM